MIFHLISNLLIIFSTKRIRETEIREYHNEFLETSDLFKSLDFFLDLVILFLKKLEMAHDAKHITSSRDERLLNKRNTMR